MKKFGGSSSFWLCLLFNILLNFEFSIPAWILLIAHFLWDISIWWFVGALAAWILFLVLWMFLVGWAADCSKEPEPPKENKNPYSVGNNKGADL